MEVYTPDCNDYKFFPVTTFRKRLAIKAPHSAHVSFTSAEGETTPMVEIYLGTLGNALTVVRYNQTTPEKVEVDTPGILTDSEHREFTFEWTSNGTLFQVYGGEDAEPFISWKNDLEPFPVTHFGVRTGGGASGEWICDDVNFIITGDSILYNYNPVEPVAGRLEFQVRAKNDAHVALTLGPKEELPKHEIVFGGWENSRCAIRHNGERPGVVEFDIQKPLDKHELRPFWIDWSSRDVRVGLGNSPDPIMTWNPRIVHPIAHFGIRTSYGSDGSWIIPVSGENVSPVEGGALPVCPAPGGALPQPPIGWVNPDVVAPGTPGGGDLSHVGHAMERISIGGVDWVEARGGSIPMGTVSGGQDDGETIYVARGRHEGDLIPGKLVPTHRVAYVAWGGGEHAKDPYEVLVASPSSVSWIAARGGNIPGNAIPGGKTSDGETLYIGRAHHKSTLTVGKVHPSHGTLYIPYGGKEIGFSEYEILVKN